MRDEFAEKLVLAADIERKCRLSPFRHGFDTAVARWQEAHTPKCANAIPKSSREQIMSDIEEFVFRNGRLPDSVGE